MYICAHAILRHTQIVLQGEERCPFEQALKSMELAGTG